MDPTAIGLLTLVCTFGGALAGIWLRGILPEQHLNGESSGTVKVGIGLVATMTALVLGLVTSSAKSSFDAMSSAVQRTATDIILLDRTLARYGAASADARAALHDLVAARVDEVWPPDYSRAPELSVPDVRRAEGFATLIQGLAPQNDDQLSLRSRALTLVEALLEARWLVSIVGTPSVLAPFLAALIFWLSITFISFGLFAPRNLTVVGTLFVCAVSVASAVFLILEMDGPFAGLIRVSPEPLRYALSHINQ